MKKHHPKSSRLPRNHQSIHLKLSQNKHEILSSGNVTWFARKSSIDSALIEFIDDLFPLRSWNTCIYRGFSIAAFDWDQSRAHYCEHTLLKFWWFRSFPLVNGGPTTPAICIKFCVIVCSFLFDWAYPCLGWFRSHHLSLTIGDGLLLQIPNLNMFRTR